MAFHGLTAADDKLRSIAQEYLEQVLPPDVRVRLWPVVGDISEEQQRRQARSLEDGVDDLLATGHTLFAGKIARTHLRHALDRAGSNEDDPDD